MRIRETFVGKTRGTIVFRQPPDSRCALIGLQVPEFSRYRLTVVKVTGRSADYAPASIEELNFFTTDSLPRACANLNSVNINVTVGGRPLVGTPEAPTILYEVRSSISPQPAQIDHSIPS